MLLIIVGDVTIVGRVGVCGLRVVITCMSSISALTLFNSFNKPLLFLVECRLGETAVVDIVLISFDVLGLMIPENI